MCCNLQMNIGLQMILNFKEKCLTVISPNIRRDVSLRWHVFTSLYSKDVFRSYFTFYFWLLISNILFLACFGVKCIENSMLDIMYFVFKDMLHILFFILLWNQDQKLKFCLFPFNSFHPILIFLILNYDL